MWAEVKGAPPPMERLVDQTRAAATKLPDAGRTYAQNQPLPVWTLLDLEVPQEKVSARKYWVLPPRDHFYFKEGGGKRSPQLFSGVKSQEEE